MSRPPLRRFFATAGFFPGSGRPSQQPPPRIRAADAQNWFSRTTRAACAPRSSRTTDFPPKALFPRPASPGRRHPCPHLWLIGGTTALVEPAANERRSFLRRSGPRPSKSKAPRSTRFARLTYLARSTGSPNCWWPKGARLSGWTWPGDRTAVAAMTNSAPSLLRAANSGRPR